MDMQLPDDFREFLKLLNDHKVEYLLIGGYAVSYYGYPRATADMDVWARVSDKNATALVNALTEYGFNVPNLSRELFLNQRNVIRMGYSPLRLEILLTISACEFDECYSRKQNAMIDGLLVPIIEKNDLLINKAASGRPKDLIDIDELKKLPD